MTLMTPLGVICSSFPREKNVVVLLLQLFPEFRHFFASLFFILSFFSLRYVSSFPSLSFFFFVSTPSLMFVSPLRSQFSFFEYVCVQVQGVSWCSFFESMRLRYMHLSRKMTSNTIANVPLLTLCACMCIISC
jgi:hypothetical protein